MEATARGRLAEGLIVFVVVANGVVLLLGLATTFKWIGAFPLTVHLVTEDGFEVGRVWAATVASRQLARGLREGKLHVDDWDYRLAEDFDGKSFVISVTCSGEARGPIELSYAEYQLLLIRLEFADGSVVNRVVEVPEGRGPRSVTVYLR